VEGFDGLTAGGALGTYSTGYFDAPSVDDDTAAEFTRRWLLTDNGDHMQIDVRVVATSQLHSALKETTVTSIVADR
jgi:hypothetical protein